LKDRRPDAPPSSRPAWLRWRILAGVLAVATILALWQLAWSPRSVAPRTVPRPGAAANNGHLGEVEARSPAAEGGAAAEDGTLRVVSAADGAPIAGVRVYGRLDDKTAFEAFSDEKGLVRLPDGQGFEYVRGRKEGYLLAGIDPTAREVRLTPALAVRGRVLLPDGRPAGGAEIRTLYEDSRQDVDEKQEADSLGRFVIAGVRPYWTILVIAKLAGYPETWSQHVAGPDEIVVRFDTGASVEGRVLGVGDRPVAGVDVYAWELNGLDPLGSERWLSEIHADAVGRTDADGRFRLSGLAVPRAHLVGARSGSRTTRSAPIELLEDGQTARVELRFRENGTVVIRVEDAYGAPIPEAKVVVPDMWGYGYALKPHAGDDSGFVTQLAPGSHAFIASAPGWRPTLVAVDAQGGPGEQVVHATLERARRLRGRVVDVSGRPVAGASVSWRAAATDPPMLSNAVSAEDGSFDLEVAAIAGARLAVSRKGLLAIDRELGVDAEDVRVVLEPAPRVTGLLPEGFEALPAVETSHTSRWAPDVIDGRIDVPCPEARRPFRLAFLGEQGAFANYGVISVDVPGLAPGEVLDLGTLAVAPPTDVRGRVVAPDGSPIMGACVEVRGVGGVTERTDPSGAFLLKQVPKTRSTVRVRAQGFPDLWCESDLDSPLSLALEAGGEVRGRVVDVVGPVGWDLEVVPVPRAPDDRSWQLSSNTVGQFHVRLPPGRYRGRMKYPGATTSVEFEGPEFTVLAGQVTDYELRLPWNLTSLLR